MPKKKVETVSPKVTSEPVWYQSKQMIIAVGAALTVLLVVGCFVAYRQYQETQRLQAELNGGQGDMKKTIEQVGKLMVLPSEEEPTFATVSDKAKLKGQPFFVAAENGDKVLIYPKAQKAILYRASLNKIINVTDVSGQSVTPTPVDESVVMKEVTIAIYNGTRVTGLASTIETQLTEKYPAVTVVQKSNAKKRDYKKTVVVDLTGQNKEAAQLLAAELKGEVRLLPSDELAPPKAQILVIAGQ